MGVDVRVRAGSSLRMQAVLPASEKMYGPLLMRLRSMLARLLF
jgi:hypothetical protein